MDARAPARGVLCLLFPHWESHVVVDMRRFNCFFGDQHFLAKLPEDEDTVEIPRKHCLEPFALRVLVAALEDFSQLAEIEQDIWQKHFEDPTGKNRLTLANVLCLPVGRLQWFRDEANRAQCV